MIGRTLGHYEITARLGQGGMGEVFLARDTRLERDVALKILPEELAADPERLERFDLEARTVAGLNHPNIVHMYSVEEVAGVRFLTMEYVEGEELGRRIETPGLGLDRVLEIGIAVAEALAEAHDKGVVHRDLKPANVMITGEGRVKVLDFGLAKLARAEEPVDDVDATWTLGLTQQGMVLGTAPYMSPEQLRGQPVDPRSDLFSLGVLLHEVATGERPFAGDTAADVTSSILKDEPSSIVALRPDLPPELDRIVRHCLEKDRERRPASAREVADGLRQLRRDLDSGVAETTVRPSVASAAASRRRPALLVALAVVVGAALSLVYWLGDRAPDGDTSGEFRRPVVAVLPFENLGGEEDAYFAAGITDEITSRLALIDGLAVISRTSARLYAGTDKPVPQVGRELGTDYVLEGAIRWDKTRDPGRVRITPRLIRVQDDTNLWSDNYEREVTEIFELQAAIASRIAEALDITLVEPVRQALDEEPTDDIEAYQAYLQGMRQLQAPGFSRESFHLGVQMFERAASLDPDFALAHARLASMHARMYHYGFDRSDERLDQARASAERALALQPNLAEARLAMGHYYYWGARDYDQALVHLEAAREVEPNNSEVWLTTAYVRRRQGDFQVAIELFERDRRLSPLDPNPLIGLGETYGVLRRYPEADAAFRRGLALAPDDPYPYTELALLDLRWQGDVTGARAILDGMPGVSNQERRRVRVLVELFDRRYDRALQLLNEPGLEAFEAGSFFTPKSLLAGMVHRLAGDEAAAQSAFEGAREVLQRGLDRNELDHRLHAGLGLALAGLGRGEEAVAHGRRAVELYPVEKDALGGPVPVIDLALVHTMLDQDEAALEQLDRLLSIPSPMSVAWLEADPRFDGLRDAAGYRELIARHRDGAGN